eukprot:1131885-Pelagomonas_calceolata.AAC.1
MRNASMDMWIIASFVCSFSVVDHWVMFLPAWTCGSLRHLVWSFGPACMDMWIIALFSVVIQCGGSLGHVPACMDMWIIGSFSVVYSKRGCPPLPVLMSGNV